MHKTVISPAALEMDALVRGPHGAWDLVPAKTAHLVIDLQVAFVAPGSIAEMPMNRETMPNVNKLAAATRAAGAQNIFVRFKHDPAWTAFYDRFSPEAKASSRAAFTPGDPQFELWPEMDVQTEVGDLILDKTRLSALIPGTCDLDAVLKSRGIDTLVVTGCVSNCCCESTIRDAVQMNYKVVFVSDGNAAFTDDAHNGAVEDLFGVFGVDISTTEEVIGRLQAAAAPAKTAVRARP